MPAVHPAGAVLRVDELLRSEALAHVLPRRDGGRKEGVISASRKAKDRSGCPTGASAEGTRTIGLRRPVGREESRQQFCFPPHLRSLPPFHAVLERIPNGGGTSKKRALSDQPVCSAGNARMTQGPGARRIIPVKRRCGVAIGTSQPREATDPRVRHTRPTKPTNPSKKPPWLRPAFFSPFDGLCSFFMRPFPRPGGMIVSSQAAGTQPLVVTVVSSRSPLTDGLKITAQRMGPAHRLISQHRMCMRVILICSEHTEL